MIDIPEKFDKKSLIDGFMLSIAQSTAKYTYYKKANSKRAKPSLICILKLLTHCFVFFKFKKKINQKTEMAYNKKSSNP